MSEVENITVYATCPKGCQYVLEKELQQLGWSNTKANMAGVSGSADLVSLYDSLLWSRVANRIVLNITQAPIKTAKDLYAVARQISWANYFDLRNSFMVDFQGTSGEIRNSTFGGLTVKDAIVDYFRDTYDSRPDVAKSNPDIRISCRLHKGQVQIGLDLSGESLHKRGYRTATGKAPLKENLAAAILYLSKWPESFEKGLNFVDPMCGSGTFLVEAAMMALNWAPGLKREHWGFQAWSGHDRELWQKSLDRANDAYTASQQTKVPKILGFDSDARVVARAWENIRGAGLGERIHVEKRQLQSLAPDHLPVGKSLLVTNPPYGERLGEVEQLKPLYQALGGKFESCLAGGRAGVFTSNPKLGREIAWRSYKQYKLFNGGLEAQLLMFELDPDNRYKHKWVSAEDRVDSAEHWRIKDESRALMLENRLRKNLKQTGKWARSQEVDCYRIYDADIPEFSFALDVYQGEDQRWLNAQEYVAPKSIDEKLALERLSEALAVVQRVFEIEPECISLKRRRVQKGKAQYERHEQSKNRFVVRELGARYWVNLKDYLDTGLFLDHRAMRRWIKSHAEGVRFLNLFCYTGAVTVQAGLGGAKSSLSVDMSRTYLEWAKQNLELNGLDLKKHQTLQEDCVAWLESKPKVEQFDLIFLDPPSFSNSKRMDDVLDVQRDHRRLIDLCMRLLKPAGTLVFSTNLRKFKLEEALSERYKVKDYTRESIDKDFLRNTHIHKCWLIEHSTNGRS